MASEMRFMVCWQYAPGATPVYFAFAQSLIAAIFQAGYEWELVRQKGLARKGATDGWRMLIIDNAAGQVYDDCGVLMGTNKARA